MGVVINTGYGQAEFWHRLSGDAEPMITTIGFKDETPGATATAIATTLSGLWQGSAKPFTVSLADSQWTYERCRVTLAVSGDLQLGENLANVVGSNVTVTVPKNCCALVRKGTGVLGRRNRGRMYLPPYALATAFVDRNGMISSTFLTPLQTALNTFLGAMDTAGYQAVILHSTSEVLPTVITSLVVQPQIATQRRRLRP